jgi:hypothetical protein
MARPPISLPVVRGRWRGRYEGKRPGPLPTIKLAKLSLPAADSERPAPEPNGGRLAR